MIEWIIDRYYVKTDKASGIVNDPNDWSQTSRSGWLIKLSPGETRQTKPENLVDLRVGFG